MTRKALSARKVKSGGSLKQVLKRRRMVNGSLVTLFSANPPVTTNLVTWLDARYPTGLSGVLPDNGTPLAQWDDLSGANRHATQATAAKRPIWKVVDGRPGVFFDGVDDWLDSPYDLPLPMTMYVVVRTSRTDSAFIGDTGGTFYLYDREGYFALWGGSARLIGPASDRTKNVASAVLNASSSSIGVNGGTRTTGDPGTSDPGALRIGSGQSLLLEGEISAVLLYSGAHDMSTRKSLEQWLGQSWGKAVTA